MSKESEGRMVIVDDSPLFRSMIKSYLNETYYVNFEEITSFKELKIFLARQDISDVLLIILDLYLPDGNSLKAIHNYKMKTGNQDLPFILVSGNLDKNAVALAKKLGAKDIISKPVNYQYLRERIDAILSDYKLTRRKMLRDYQEEINLEIKRAQRGEYSLSILLTGIFHAETLTSLYKDSGLLKLIDLEKTYPDKLKNMMRETDTIVNLSPSEYLFVLPFTDITGVPVVVDKINKVYQELVPAAKQEELLMVIASVTFPEEETSTEELLPRLEENFKQKLLSMNQNPLPP